MPRTPTPLNAQAIKNAKPKDKDYKMTDGQGLYLLVTSKGGKNWRLKYRMDGKEHTYAIGTYPEISVADARKIREDLRSDIAKGISPCVVRKQKKVDDKVKAIKDENTFEKVATEYLGKLKDKNRNEAYLVRLRKAFENDAYPFIGNKPIIEITAKDIANIVLIVEKRGAIESAHRLFSQINKVFSYGVTMLMIEDIPNKEKLRNPCNDIDKSILLQSHTLVHFPTIVDSAGIRELLKDIDESTAYYTTKMALTLAPYVALRPSNLRFAEWEEIDFETQLWSIPKAKMKNKKDFLIPMTGSVIRILKEVQQVSGAGKYVFPGLRSKVSPLSENTLNAALRKMGYSKDKIVVHGFRSMFSTVLNEDKRFDKDIIDIQLAHTIGSKVHQAYDRAVHIDERTKIMQWWSDYLDDLKK